MFPGMNPRKMQGMMKKMGIQQQELPATRVIIECEDKNLIIMNPQVSKVNMMGQETFQITGEVHEQEKQPQITDEDVKTVMNQTGKNAEEVRKALLENDGDLADTILKLKE